MIDAGHFIEAPKFCGACGTPLLVTEEDVFDRQTGQPLVGRPRLLACRYGHEQWGRTSLGTWVLL